MFRSPWLKSQNSTLKLLLMAVIFSHLLSLTTGFAMATDGIKPILVYIGMVGVYIFLIPIFFLTVAQPKFKMRSNEAPIVRSAVIVALLACAYFGIWLIFGAVIGQHPKDVVGSTGRALIPFLVVAAAANGLGTSNQNARKHFFQGFIVISFFFTLISAMGKVTLLVSGYYYGAGLNQFSFSGFLMAWVVLLILKSDVSPSKKHLTSVLLGVLVLLSILSFKRGAWVGMIATMACLALPLNIKRKTRALAAALVMVVLGFAILTQWGMTDRLISRYEYTFSGKGTGLAELDGSAFARVAELAAATYTLNQSPMKLGWLIGLGPGAGYLNPHNYRFSNLNEHGEPYHIHPGIGIITFRYGLAGLFLYLSFVLFALRAMFGFARFLKKGPKIDLWHPSIVGFSAAVGIVSGIPGLFTSNSYFGSLGFGFLVVIVVYSWAECRQLLRIPAQLPHRKAAAPLGLST